MGTLENKASLLTRKVSKKQASVLLVLLLYFVFVDEIADNFLITSSAKLFSFEGTIVCLLQGLQIIFSSLQAGYSDYYSRKRSLVLSLFATLCALVLFRFSISFGASFIIFAIILKGVLGNTLPIAWAAIADIKKENNFRFALALSICALAIGSWGSVSVVPHLKTIPFFYSTLVLLGIGLCFIALIFKDASDSAQYSAPKVRSFWHLISDECIAIFTLLKKPVNFLVLVTFFFSEISFYQMLFRVEIFDSYPCLMPIPISIGIGYTLGTVTLKYLNKYSDKSVTTVGLLMSIISISIIAIIGFLKFESGHLFTILFSMYSFGYAFFTPALFSLITPKKHPHLQGKIYGILESTDSLASLITFVLILVYGRLSCNSVFLFSLVMILFSAVFLYIVFKRIQRDHTES